MCNVWTSAKRAVRGRGKLPGCTLANGGRGMNIQIFGTSKSFDTKKAERYFKERRIKYQFIDLKEKGLSKGELTSVAQAAGGIDALINPGCKDRQTAVLVQYLGADQKLEKVLENQQVLREPIVRNGRQATVGYQPDVWKTWE
jgi:arsenate reductase-like glutaredoxin family protein